MSGTVVGRVDAVIPAAGAPQNTRNQFVITKLFLDQHVAAGNAQLVASNVGSGGQGFRFHDEADPLGDNSFAVYRFLASASTNRTTDFYVAIQQADSANWGTAPGNPGSLDNVTSVDGVGLIMCYREGGGDPWNGTTNAVAAATITSGNTENFALVDGQTLTVDVNNVGAVAATFETADFGDIANATAAEVASVINQDIPGILATVSAGAVVLTTTRSNSTAEIEVTGGTANGALGFSLTPVTGTGADDTKGATVWVGADLHMMSNQMQSGGPRFTLKEDMHRIYADPGSTSSGDMGRYIMVGDADCIFIWNDASNDNSANGQYCFGAYEPHGDVTVANPYFFLSPFSANNVFPGGSSTVYGSTWSGGLIGVDESDAMQNFITTGTTAGLNDSATSQPVNHPGMANPLYTTSPFYLSQASGLGSGYIGEIPTNIVAFTWGMPGNDSTADFTRAFIPGGTSPTTAKFSIPWNGTSAPLSSTLREGEVF